jgi:hypothetical protein
MDRRQQWESGRTKARQCFARKILCIFDDKQAVLALAHPNVAVESGHGRDPNNHAIR